MKTKICSGCKIEKDVSDFYKSKNDKSGFASYCKKCNSKHHREYQIKYRKQINKQHSDWRNKNKKVRLAIEKAWRLKNKDKIEKYNKIRYRNNKLKENPNYIFNIYRGMGWKSIRAKTLKRDKYRCQYCRIKTNEVHHKDKTGSNRPERKKNNELENLITLCHKCHIGLHQNRKFGNDCSRKPERDNKIFRLLSTKTQSEISRMFGITRQRVNQIVNKDLII